MSLTGERPHPVLLMGTAGVVIGLVIATGDFIRLGWSRDRLSLVGYFLALVAAASFGGSNVAAKQLTIAYGSPLMITAFSLFFGVLLLAPLAGHEAIRSLRTSGKEWKFGGSAALSGLSSTLAVVSLYYALQLEDVTLVTPISSITPILTLLLAHIFIGRLERISPRIVIGTLVTMIGVMFVVFGRTL